MRIVLIIISYFICLPAYAQFFINGGAEVSQNGTLPYGWVAVGGKAVLNSNETYSGNHSLCFSFENNGQTKSLALSLLKDYAVKDLNNKTLLLKAKVKSKFEDSAKGGRLFVQIIRGNVSEKLAYSQTFGNFTEWNDVEVSLAVEDQLSAGVIALGVEISDRKGKIWLDDIELYADGRVISQNVRVDSLNKDEKVWLDENTYNLKNVTLNNYIGGATIVGIGEETHNSRNVKSSRLCVANELVNNNQFTIILEELKPFKYSQLETEYFTISNDGSENYNITQLINGVNAQHKIRFTGADISPEVLIDELAMIGGTALNSDIAILRTVMLPVVNNYVESYSGLEIPIKFNEEQKQKIVNALQNCEEWANANITNAKRKSGCNFTIKMLRESLYISPAKRDSLMAEVVGFVSQLSNEKIIFFAHNMHVYKGDIFNKSSGYFLNKKFLDKYYAIASTFYGGQYKARDMSRHDSAFVTIDASYAFPGTYEYLLNFADKSNYLLPLRGVNLIKKENDWIFNKMLCRTVGSVQIPDEFGYIYDITKQFDAVIFMKDSHI